VNTDGVLGKRHAPDDSTFDFERFNKRLNLLSIGESITRISSTTEWEVHHNSNILHVVQPNAMATAPATPPSPASLRSTHNIM